MTRLSCIGRVRRAIRHGAPRGTPSAPAGPVRQTRLFHTLVVVGAALTGSAFTAGAVVATVSISGCSGSSANDDLGPGYPDIGVPWDLSRSYPDIGVPPDLSRNYPDIGIPDIAAAS